MSITALSTSVRVTADTLRGARCKGTGLWWTKVEAASAQARSDSRRNFVAAAALEMCVQCPVRSACADWAADAQYTGIAGGAVLHDGQPLTEGRRRVIELVEAA